MMKKKKEKEESKKEMRKEKKIPNTGPRMSTNSAQFCSVK